MQHHSFFFYLFHSLFSCCWTCRVILLNIFFVLYSFFSYVLNHNRCLADYLLWPAMEKENNKNDHKNSLYLVVCVFVKKLCEREFHREREKQQMLSIVEFVSVSIGWW